MAAQAELRDLPSSRIVNEVRGINRVVYDITSNRAADAGARTASPSARPA